MDADQIVSYAIAITAILGGGLAYFKRKPGQKEKDQVDVGLGTLNLAKGSIQLVTETLDQQFRRMDAEMDEMRAEHAQYRADTDDRLAELSAELRRAKAGERHWQDEAERLKHRVTELEAEVARLKARP
jgi:predicted  nucleic acid-binding Zn-ribbon protein